MLCAFTGRDVSGNGFAAVKMGHAARTKQNVDFYIRRYADL